MIQFFSAFAISAAMLVSQVPSPAYAQSVTATVAPDVQVKLTLERITVEAGKQVLVATERAAPGEQVQYVAAYTNTAALTTAPIAKLQATLPVPAAMRYAGSAQPTPALASLDGKTFEAYPLVRMVKQADGSLKKVDVPFDEYRSLRWTIQSLAPQTAQAVKARMTVATAPPPNKAP